MICPRPGGNLWKFRKKKKKEKTLIPHTHLSYSESQPWILTERALPWNKTWQYPTKNLNPLPPHLDSRQKKKKKKVVCFNLPRNAANFVNVIQTDFLAKFIGRIPPYAVAVKSKDLCWLWICPRVEEKRSRIRKSHGFSAPWVFWAFQVDIYFSWLCFQ